MNPKHNLTSHHTSVYGQNATIRSTSLTPKSPRRSPNPRFHDFSRHLTKIGGLRDYPNPSNLSSPQYNTNVPIYAPRTMRNYYNKPNWTSPTRSKSPHRIFIRRSYGPGNLSYSYPNTLGINRRNTAYNRPRTNLLCIILPCKHKL